ncbi:RRP12-like protein [Senna tora]|uniref:RRP12-like protein n=1 Tax=Senna tora TaxID=362788 RepID=A0A834TC61_9FABA|nr:RRP12-like protein [Senna tora]
MAPAPSEWPHHFTISKRQLKQGFVDYDSANHVTSSSCKKSAISQDVLAQAHQLWGLLHSFCPRATASISDSSVIKEVFVSLLEVSVYGF